MSREDNIRAAMSWCHLFLREAHRLLDGKQNQFPRAAAQLYVAIEQIDGKPCTHDELYRHEKTGECVDPDCQLTK